MLTYPADRETELRVLGCAMERPHGAEKLLESLGVEGFQDGQLAQVFDVMRRIDEGGGRIGPATVAALLTDSADYSADEVSQLLRNIAHQPAMPSELPPLLAKLRKLAALRALMDAGLEVHRAASEQADPSDVIEEAYSALGAVAEGSRLTGGADMQASLRSLEQDLEASRERFKRFGAYGVPNALAGVAHRLKGYQPPRLHMLAGRPGSGKTAYALQETLHAALRGFPVYWASYELGRVELIQRLLQQHFGINADSFRENPPTGQAAAEYMNARIELEGLPIFIDDDPAQTFARIRIGAKRFFKGRLGLVVIDYLQKIPVPRQLIGKGENDKVGWAAPRTKNLAKALQCPVLALVQMNRAIEYASRRPRMSDLRGSGWLEQEADWVQFIHNPEDEANPATREIVCAKARQGQPGIDYCEWYGSRLRFQATEQL